MRKLRSNMIGKMLIAAGLLGGAALTYNPTPAFAQSNTAGGLRGIVRDKATREPLIGATVVATSPALQGEQVVITDESGAYFIDTLPPGTYLVTVYYNDAKFERGGVLIQLGKQAVVNVPVDTGAAAAKGETIIIEGNAPIVDQGSTKTGATITKDYTNNIPVGRTFGGVLGAAAGSQGDQYGVSLAGSTSPENVYIVEGLNTTDTGVGGLSTNLPNEFVGETEIITGGYNAEFGRATGGVVNVVTKSGSNEFHGTVFGYFRNSGLAAAADRVDRQGNAIDTETNLDYAYDVGAELGGPIIKDKLWFHVGFNPSFTSQTIDRIVNRAVDADGDGAPDVNPDTGFSVQEEVSRSGIPFKANTYFFTAKLNYALSQDHQLQVSAFGNPRSSDDVYRVTGAPNAQRYKVDDGALDFAMKWSSKFADGKTQVDLVAGYHNQKEDQNPYSAAEDATQIRYDYERPLYDFADLEGASTIAGCMDPDPNDDFEPCPISLYTAQGLGFLESRVNNRTSAVLGVTQRVKLAGYHTFKVGGDVELSTYDTTRRYTGDARRYRMATANAGANGGIWRVDEFVKYDTAGTIPCGVDANGDDMLDSTCSLANELTANTSNQSFAAYLQDSWQVLPNLTLNAGVRWERQIAFQAEAIQGTIDTDTGQPIPDEAFRLANMIAPRLGVIYDPTQEGRAKLFGHWGRFYENVPMDINVRAFGGEISRRSFLNRGANAGTCNVDHGAPMQQALLDACTDLGTAAGGVSNVGILGGASTYVAPRLEGQYTQELILGGEYELLSDLKLGANFIRRSIPTVIEDLSTDGAHVYFVANPGEDYSAEANELRASVAGLAEDDPARVLAEGRADQLDAVGGFDKPVRDYNAIQITANQRPSSRSLLQASYTYSRSKGNFPGLYSTETGQLDPNLTSMYDLADLMANRYGAMGLDRPHNFKLDGFYQFDLKAAGGLTVGTSLRAQSGIAHNTLAGHPLYGDGESYILERGSFRRSPTTYQIDLKAAYGYKISKTTTVEAFVDIFNLLNAQRETDTDEIYTYDSMNPVVGGDTTDLLHAKVVNPNSGVTDNATATQNPNFGSTSALQAPLSMRLGARLTF
ncbi:MAG: TonB-dependent receptor [Kofleriaceae bacterium]|nr:TonB-dependent receptor [Kofleriaceae bacterium]